MRPIGFSTGALAHADFRGALDCLQSQPVNAVELSALRYPELRTLLESIETLALDRYSHIGIHAPSCFNAKQEIEIASLLHRYVPSRWPIILHPDTIHEFAIWEEFGQQLAIENMDRRKPTGRTAKELSTIFERLPQAMLCFDIGHARQCDTTMTEAFQILTEYEDRLGWMHVSEVNTLSHHEPLSYAASSSFAEVAYLIPETVPAILEARISLNASGAIRAEIETVRRVLSVNQIQPACA